ncbi:DUF2927 domain-containing protein [Vibrio aestuarianus]|uniref:DUF2927 domain-containing protein n=1 Tax=Vibrio aestuarianus TaxID=28171 RepID=UPI0021C3511A|nr:DUF2927 domain-containing protein [Vibrio aestuarianus]MDE1208714.1 DUF2927 domain-containing protein [Vibrio aestuarianus]MDE1316584.1 DUF2927 domain-containing protein [Vibrio aestuarianus]CAH8213570.1 conserved exported hypothetical protein [Vibrio aestuarianus]
MLGKVRLAACLLLVFSASAWAYSETWKNKSFISKAFVQVALRNEYNAGKYPLVKWTQPVKIWVQHDVPDKALHDELVDLHIQHLALVTQHPIYRVSNRDEANVTWIFTKEAKWDNEVATHIGKSSLGVLNSAICIANYTTDIDTHEIIKAVIIIPVDKAHERGKLLACIVEEITQVLGLPNDSQQAYPSIFNDETPEELLSPLDVILLSMLYDKRLKTGMQEKEVKSVIQSILKEYEQQGVLNNAVTLSKSAPLYQLIGY